MSQVETLELDLELVHPFGEISVPVREEVPKGYTIDELIQEHAPRLNLPTTDPTGRPQVYQALLEREQERLFGSQRVAEVIEPGDEIVLQPYIAAGGTAAK